MLWGFLIAIIIPTHVLAQFVDSPKREYRAVWLTTIKGLDWPREEHQGNYAAQRAHLGIILDSLQAININTVLLQTRIRGDVIYSSDIEPFAPVFSGRHGVAPDYDPLAFAIEECHRRGMQLHAWLVTIPLGDAAYVQGHDRQSLPAKKRSQCTRFKGAWYMEPSHPGTIEHLSALVEELVMRYDVDGIHFDYIRYPEGNSSYPDVTFYNQSKQRGQSKNDWRRSNITTLMRTLYAKVKGIKPWVCVSAATLGKHGDTSRYGSYGWNAYHTVHQEAQEWMREGIIDALFPMLYYAGRHFYPFVTDWHEHSYGRHVIAGMGTYQLHPDEKNWNLEEIVRQLNVIRAHPTGGAAQFRSKFVTDNTKGVYDYLRLFYSSPALPPAMVWLDSIAPQPPNCATVQQTSIMMTLQWSASKDSDVVAYNIYRCDSLPINISHPKNLLRASLHDTIYKDFSQGQRCHYAVTAIDRYGNESIPMLIK